MNRLKKFGVILLALIVAIVLFIYIPKPARMYAKRRNIQSAVVHSYIDDSEHEINEDKYDELFKIIDKAYVITSRGGSKVCFKKYKLIISYTNGKTCTIENGYISGTIMPIKKFDIDMNAIAELANED